MKKVSVFCIFTAAVVFADYAHGFDLYTALRATYENCVGIDDELYELKKMAGINNAITSVGTGLGIGATAAGIAKANIDAEIEGKKGRLRGIAYSASNDVETVSRDAWMNDFSKDWDETDEDADIIFSDETTTSKSQETPEDIKSLTTKSKKLGHWRTGLLVGNTTTNIAGAAIAGNNKVEQPLQEQIQNCISAVKDLQNTIIQAKINGEDVTEATEIESACKDFEYVDITKINDRAKGSMVSSIVGTGTGVVGTITSALANSDDIRNDDSIQGKKKEKNLNTAANVLSAGSTVASATATVFNAGQINAIKDVAMVAEKCTRALK